MDERVKLFKEVFPDSQVYPNMRELPKNRFPEVKKWQRWHMSEYVTYCVESKGEACSRITPRVSNRVEARGSRLERLARGRGVISSGA
jgi:hypothetical protein